MARVENEPKLSIGKLLTAAKNVLLPITCFLKSYSIYISPKGIFMKKNSYCAENTNFIATTLQLVGHFGSVLQVSNLSYPRKRVSIPLKRKWIPFDIYSAIYGKGMTMWVVFLALLVGLTSGSIAQTPDWLWAKSAGGTSNDFGQSIAVDANGNSYVTGSFGSPTITFGSTTLTNSSSGNGDIFVVKYDASGNVVWRKALKERITIMEEASQLMQTEIVM